MRTTILSACAAAALLGGLYFVVEGSGVIGIINPASAVKNAPDPTTSLPFSVSVKTKHAQLKVVLYDPETEQSFGPMSRREVSAWRHSYPHAEVLVPDSAGRYPKIAEPDSFKDRFAAIN